MDLPLRISPFGDRWRCQGCGICCRGVIIPLSDDEYLRIRRQGWQSRPEFAGRKLFVRVHPFRRKYRLAQRADGYCVFLSPQGRCRIHEEFGEEAKPLVCRMFPYQIVPLERFAYLTVRRNCPSAAREIGPTLDEQTEAWRPLAEDERLRPRAAAPPPLSVSVRGGWRHFHRVCDSVERLIRDERFPMVRRLVHAAMLANMLDRCRPQIWADENKLRELLRLLEGAIPEEAGAFFRERQPPGATARLLMRRTILDYLRLHPRFALENTWADRLRWIATSLSLGWGRGRIPAPAVGRAFQPWKPALASQADGTGVPESPRDTASPGWVELAELENPLGPLDRELLRPLDRYFESMAVSRRFAVRGRRGWPLTDRIRALSLSFAVGMWMLRWSSPDRGVTDDDVIDAVIALDRGEGHAPQGSRGYRQRLRALDRLGQIPRLLAWYVQ
ncbi:MAG: YkgJ family cysteine cluster protein [Thermogutta sp.]|nr:YkgJ family cysteine cluster protein [Thermogutta sp.]